MASVKEIIFNTYDNISLLLFKQDGIAIDFTGFTRFTLELGGVTVDTDIDSTTITTTATQGELKFDIGDKSIPVGSHNATLVWYDASHTNGQVLACSDDKDLIFQVKTCT